MDHSARIEFCPTRAHFCSLELSFIDRSVICPTLIIRGTDLLLHRYQCKRAARAADRKSPSVPFGLIAFHRAL